MSGVAFVAFSTVACWSFDYVAPPADADAPDARVPCVEGGLYCGGDRLVGETTILYRCQRTGSGTVVARCAERCLVSPPGKDDACSAATSCVTGGSYCGGDKVNGDPDVLYRCGSGSTTTVIERCARGCAVNTGRDDACK